ncbi:phosphonate C-P lyase system protein PhnL [uncultured Desulfovibrio sp.]|uniref:phosphonate C-P lyase system protein PhnL n=1 Tax=uncultured Desulfovibrio sp. TaxID=167968 RepID=UPI00266B6F93|nr:phosphonate C-P lyase system protein PhnL [uncultured Desulfovibrio sp.]
MLTVRKLAKNFTLHAQGGVHIAAFSGLNLEAYAGRCLVLHGPSGAGKSTLMRCLYANYKACSGSILVRHRNGFVDMVTARPRAVLDVRRETMGYVSQFLRVIPRVSTLDIVAGQCTAHGEERSAAREKAAVLLDRLHIPQRLWNLAPATFSGGEQQRVNIARGFIRHSPVLLLDEPTASLDAANKRTVVTLIAEAKARGSAVIGIFHDDEVREAVADAVFHLQPGRNHAS